jgi:dihydroorotase/N-acyl-D-amino-acid deacylase
VTLVCGPNRLIRSTVCVGVLLCALIAGRLRAQVPNYDLLIRNGRIVDGTGSPWFYADVAITGDRITAIGRGLIGTARQTFDARANELVVAPGFIDLHVHAFGGVAPLPAVPPILEVPDAANYVRQGVTTLISGPDGFSPVPLRPVLDRIVANGITPNLGTFIGHGSIRNAVMGGSDRAPDAAELRKMNDLVRDGMRDGAFGLSTGLFYVPAAFSKTDEVVELAKVAGAMGGIHISHIRDEASGVAGSVRETIQIGEEGRLPTQVTHHKTIGKTAWGKT